MTEAETTLVEGVRIACHRAEQGSTLEMALLDSGVDLGAFLRALNDTSNLDALRAAVQLLIIEKIASTRKSQLDAAIEYARGKN
jgi:hypothetical protein